MILSFSGAAVVHLCLASLLAYAIPLTTSSLNMVITSNKSSPALSQEKPIRCSTRNSPNNSTGNQSPSQFPKLNIKKQFPRDSIGKKFPPKKSDCPCAGSSSGKDWVLKCPQCGQHWHGACANLKGTRSLAQAAIDKISSDWLCPWCWICPYPKDSSHTSSVMEKTLVEKTLSSSVFERLSDTVTAALKNSLPSFDLSALQEKLDNLNQEIKDFKDSASLAPSTHLNSPHESDFIPPPITSARPLQSTERPYEDFKENYLTTDEFESLNDLAGVLRDDGHFIDEKGHKVVLYGEQYKYTGSRLGEDTPDPIPHEIAALIDRVTSDLSLKHKPNSVLINFYPASGSGSESHLAMHSDDEASIVADSKIVTVSLWESRKIVFESKHHDGEPTVTELIATPNSIYSMTRASQNWFKHGVPQPPAGEDFEERISITLRCVSNMSDRSILLIGDSNTKEIVFGTGSGKVGASYPGKRIKSSKVENINPAQCVGYQNVFLHCGTNDLRCEYVTGKDYIHKVVGTLQTKVSEIKKLCPDVCLFVVPVLPTRNRAMNEHIMYYNNLVGRMISHYFPDVWFEGIYSFLDRQGLLDAKLTRNGNDDIHLGKKGIALYVSLMKRCVFRRLRTRQYSNATQGSTHVMNPSRDT